jgi:hypothetical protein
MTEVSLNDCARYLMLSVLRYRGQKEESQEAVFPLKPNFRYDCCGGAFVAWKGVRKTSEQGLYATNNLSISELRGFELRFLCPRVYSLHTKSPSAILASKSRTATLHDCYFVT